MLCVVLAGFLLIVGWWPFMPFPRNQVSWLAGRHGLAFGPPGVAYDPEPLPMPVAHPSDNQAPGFAVELSLEPAIEPENGVPHILTIHDGRTPSRFVIGQWQSQLLVRVPAPGEPNRIRETGIAGLRKGQPRVIAISGDATATTFYIDGRLSGRMPDFVLDPDALRGTADSRRCRNRQELLDRHTVRCGHLQPGARGQGCGCPSRRLDAGHRARARSRTGTGGLVQFCRGRR